MKVGVLASGGGSNFQALVDGLRGTPAQLCVLICNVPGAFALERAKAAGVPAVLLDHRLWPDRAAYDVALAAELLGRGVELVCLAGYMRLVGRGFLAAFPQRVLNVHPALLPAFPGLHGARQALNYGAKVAGCTVHFVDEGTDTGPVIAQAAVPVHDDDTEQSLQARIQHEEHRLYPAVVQWVAEGRVTVEGRRVRVQELA
jgi:phosphoribosylglycinamide formyltransferase-1